MKPTGVIYNSWDHATKKLVPNRVIILSGSIVVGAGNPDTFAAGLAKSVVDHFSGMTGEPKEVEMEAFVQRAIDAKASLEGPPEVISYTGAGKQRVDVIVNGFTNKHADRLLGKS